MPMHLNWFQCRRCPDLLEGEKKRETTKHISRETSSSLENCSIFIEMGKDRTNGERRKMLAQRKIIRKTKTNKHTLLR